MQKTIYAGIATLDDLSEIRNDMESALRNSRLDEETCASMVLVVDEWVTNIVTHGYNSKGGEIKLDIETNQHTLQICTRDQGCSFDISTAPNANTDVPPTKAGGMGLELIRRLVDSIDYQREKDGWNHTCFTKHVM